MGQEADSQQEAMPGWERLCNVSKTQRRNSDLTKGQVEIPYHSIVEDDGKGHCTNLRESTINRLLCQVETLVISGWKQQLCPQQQDISSAGGPRDLSDVKVNECHVLVLSGDELCAAQGTDKRLVFHVQHE